jgi:hypothetical protein
MNHAARETQVAVSRAVVFFAPPKNPHIVALFVAFCGGGLLRRRGDASQSNGPPRVGVPCRAGQRVLAGPGLVPVLLRAEETAASQFQVGHAEAFVRYLRTLRVAPNGRPQSATRPLLDKGIQFIFETCRSLFVFAGERRLLSPYADNPFSALELGRLRIEHRRPILLP